MEQNKGQETITLLQLMHIVLNDLESIMVPGGLLEQIGMPLNRAIRNVHVAIEAMDRQPEPAAPEEAEENADADV